MKYPKGKKGRDFRLETYFMGGKMKHRRVPLIDGMEVEAFLLAHADDSILIQDGYEHLISQRHEMMNTDDTEKTRNEI